MTKQFGRIDVGEWLSDKDDLVNPPSEVVIKSKLDPDDKSNDKSHHDSRYIALKPFRTRSMKLFRKGMTVKDRMTYFVNMIFYMASFRWVCNNLVENMEFTAPSDVYDRLLGEWSTIGIVSSLMMSFGKLDCLCAPIVYKSL